MPTESRLKTTPPTGHGRARGLVSGRASGARIDARTFAPPAALADVVASYWVGRWDLPADAPHETQLLSDPCAHLVFETPGGPHPGARLVGVWTRLWRRQLAGRGQVRGVKLRAGALRAFVDLPATRLQNRIVPLEPLFPDTLAGLPDVMLNAETDEHAFAELTSFLLRSRRTHEHDRVSAAVALVQRIASHPELQTVEQLASASGLGVRALQRLFRHHVGATPKWVIRRHRLQEVALRLERGDPHNLATLAADLGYTDQAHMARDFKAATGKTPRAFATQV